MELSIFSILPLNLPPRSPLYANILGSHCDCLHSRSIYRNGITSISSSKIYAPLIFASLSFSRLALRATPSSTTVSSLRLSRHGSKIDQNNNFQYIKYRMIWITRRETYVHCHYFEFSCPLNFSHSQQKSHTCIGYFCSFLHIRIQAICSMLPKFLRCIHVRRGALYSISSRNENELQ